jgi:hypothetical protein
LLGLEVDLAEKIKDTLSFHDFETTEDGFGDIGMTQPVPTSSFCVILVLGAMTKPSLSSSSELLWTTGENPGLVLSSASNLPVPINSIMAFPKE